MKNRKFVFEMNEALYKASKVKEENAMPDGVMGFVMLPISTISLNKRNAEIISNSARNMGITPDQLVNKIIETDVYTAERFHKLDKEFKELLK